MLNRLMLIALAALVMVIGCEPQCGEGDERPGCYATIEVDWTVNGARPAAVCPRDSRVSVVLTHPLWGDQSASSMRDRPCPTAPLEAGLATTGRYTIVAELRAGDMTLLDSRTAELTVEGAVGNVPRAYHTVRFVTSCGAGDTRPHCLSPPMDAGTSDLCAGVTCRVRERCNPSNGSCECEPGTALSANADGGIQCVLTAADAAVDIAPDVPTDTADGAPADASGCPAGFGRCEGVCLPLTRDNGNCGRCGVACDAATQACVEGQCRQRCDGGGGCPSERACTATSAGMVCLARCTAPRIDCGGSCTDTRTTAAHCGWCTRRCYSNELCRDGACEPITCETTGQTPCGTTCRNLQIDRSNCGACFRVCATGQDCSLGVCSCRPDEVLCGGACANTMFDSMHCGGCGVRCGAVQRCVRGTCQDICSPAQLACAVPGGVLCYGPTTFEHCGACGRQCAAGEFCARTCPTCPSSCLPQCAPNRILCAGTCVAPNIDRANCGGCGMACPAGQMCISGVCQV